MRRTSPAPLWSLTFALLALAPFGSGCGSEDTDPLNDGGPRACQTNDGCAADQWCQSGTCAAGTGNACTADEQCGPGEACRIVTECGATRCSGNACVPRACNDHGECDGLVCLSGACAPRPACGEALPCPAGLLCEDGLCTPRTEPLPCSGDGECPGQICVDGACVDPIACTSTAECPVHLRCIREVCRPPCTQNSDCGSQLFTCDTASGECRSRCLNDDQCPRGTYCSQFTCVPGCEDDADCNQARNEVCDGAASGHGRCIQVTPCASDGSCPQGSICDPNTNRCRTLPACRTDRDCSGSAYCESGFCFPAMACTNMSCGEGFDCVGGTCVPFTCRGPADCTSPEQCIAGRCQEPGNTNFVTEVRIISPAGVVRPGTRYRYVALAQDPAGRVVPGVTFRWTLTSTTVATIDAAGLATGGSVAGTTEVRAAVDTPNGPVTSSPVGLTNLGPLADGAVRVVVVRQTNGTAVSGARVEIIRGGTVLASVTTDGTGVALFPSLDPGPLTVTAAHPDLDWVTLVEPAGSDFLVPLPPRTRPTEVAGVTGRVDLAQVTTRGDISLSVSGASAPSPLFGFDASETFGADNFNVQVPMLGSIPIPAANTVSVSFMGFPFDLKDRFYARGAPGLRALWSFGGRIELGTNGLSVGDLNNIAAAILPFFQRFEHTVQPGVSLLAYPMVPDADDIDGDGNRTELRPDWNAFPTAILTPSVTQTLRYRMRVDPLPFVTGGNANTLIVMAGVILPGIGFVPLGLDGQSDRQGSGIVASFTTKLAPPHGGLEAGEYAVLATALRFGMTGPTGPGASRLFVGARLPAEVNLSSGWMDAPVNATFEVPTRTVTLPPLPGADAYRVAFGSAEGTWHVYGGSGAGGELAVPNPPQGLTDRLQGARVTVDALDLEAGVSAGQLFDAARGGAAGMDRVTRGFSRMVLGN